MKLLAYLLIATALVTWTPRARARQSTDPSEARKVPISVSDFELSSMGPARGNPRITPGSGQRKSGEPVYADSDPAPVQARRIIDSFANTLVELLRKAGYSVKRISGTP